MDEFYRVSLTSGEVKAILALLHAAEPLLEGDRNLPGEFDTALLASIRERITEEVPEFVAGQAERLGKRLLALLEGAQAKAEVPEAFVSPLVTVRQMLENARSEDTPAEIEYYVPSREEWTWRTIDVDDVYENEGTWYVTGHCHLRNDFRQFRLDRIRSVRLKQNLTDERSNNTQCKENGEDPDPFDEE